MGKRKGSEAAAAAAALAFALALALDDDVAGFLPLSSRRDADADLVFVFVVDALGALLVGISGMNPAKLENRCCILPMFPMAPMLPKAPKLPSPPKDPRPGNPPNILKAFLGSKPASGLFFGSREAPKRAAVLGSKAPNIFGSKAANKGFFGSAPRWWRDERKLGLRPAKLAKFSPDVEAEAPDDVLAMAEDVPPPPLEPVAPLPLEPAAAVVLVLLTRLVPRFRSLVLGVELDVEVEARLITGAFAAKGTDGDPVTRR